MARIGRELSGAQWDETSFAFAPALILWSAVKLGIFTAIDHGARSAEEIAVVTGSSLRGTRMLLKAMSGLGFLEKNRLDYGLSEFGRRYFLASSGDYIGSLFEIWEQLLRYWLDLPEVVSADRPTVACLPRREREAFNLRLVEALFQVHKQTAWELARQIRRTVAFSKILDVAAGSAVWSLPLVLSADDAQATAVDWASVLDVAKRHTRRWGVEHRYRFLAGDIHEVDFGSGEYDLVLLGHICHSEGARRSKTLITKSFHALRPSGRLLIMDYVVDEDRNGDILPFILALNALLGTEEGDTFPLSDYRDWLLQAGFVAVEILQVGQHSPVIVGIRGGPPE